MKKNIIKLDIIFIILLIIFLSFFTLYKINKNYRLSLLSKTFKNMILVRKSIDEFHVIYKTYPNKLEIQGLDSDKRFFSILEKNSDGNYNMLNNFKFPSTPNYTRKVDGVLIKIGASNSIKICNKLENLGLNNKLYSSNGGWIYSPLNGEFRANLQKSIAKNSKKNSSRPLWGDKIDWYYH